MKVTLVIFLPDGSRKDIRLKAGKYIVGRQDDATIRIPLPVVSRHHCEIKVEDSRVRVRDLGSSNGTFRNFERITESDLGAGDILGLGEFLLTVQVDGQPAQVSPPKKPAQRSADSSMADTPPPSPTPPQRASKPKAKPAEDDDDSQTVDGDEIEEPLVGGKQDESSIFDFDFDFEDEDRPRL